MKCLRQITKIRWQDQIRIAEGLGPVSETITRRQNSQFNHVATLAEDTPAQQFNNWSRSRSYLMSAVPRWPITSSSTWCRLETLSSPFSKQVAWPTPQGQQHSTHLLISEDEPSHVDTRWWRYGLCRLRVNEDDEYISHSVQLSLAVPPCCLYLQYK